MLPKRTPPFRPVTRFINAANGRPRRPACKVDPVTLCWLWQGATRGGYGVLKVNGQAIDAHRFFYEERHGPIPVGMELDHVVCQNHTCCNPDHVEPVPHVVNVRRGRTTKLTLAMVAEIRALVPTHTYQEVATRFGISKGHVCRIVKNQSWRE